MKIKTLSELSGLPAPTIRYYEKIQLLPKVVRGMNGYREYTQDDLQRLVLIQQAQQVGFSLAEIKTLLPSDLFSWGHDNLKISLESKIAEIEKLEAQLAKNKANLQAILDGIINKPTSMSCADNAHRLLEGTKLLTNQDE